MKTLRIILIVLLVLIILFIAGVQIFLTKGLSAALNDVVFPAVKSVSGLEMSISDASVNIFKGRAQLEDFKIRNLEGYEEPYLFVSDKCLVEVDLISLIQPESIIIKQVETIGSTLTVERNKDKKINVKELAEKFEKLQSKQDPKDPEPSEPKTPKEKKPTTPVHIRRIIVDAGVVYADTRKNRRYPLRLRLTGTDLFSVPKENHPQSLIVLRGSLKDDEKAFTTDLTALIDPLVDPKAPTFRMSGSILGIDKEFLEKLLKKNDMESGPFSIKPDINCEKGQLEGSYIDFLLTDVVLFGSNIGDTTVNIPIRGTIQDREYDMSGAIRALFSQQSSGEIIKAIGMKELGIEAGETTQETVINAITNSVDEIAESPALQELIEVIIPGTNATPDGEETHVKEKVTDALAEQLGDSVKELDKEDTEAIKGLLNNIFGD